MYHRYFILAILLLPLFVTPSIAFRPAATLTSKSEVPVVESRLKAEIQSSTTSVSALLEFQDTLTNAEIVQAERTGIKFVRRGSTIVNVGTIYSAKVEDVSSLDALSSLGLVRATSGSKQYVPSLSSSVSAIRADDVWTNLKKDGGDLNGSGARVAVLDTGATWTHPSFWRASPGEYRTISNAGHYFVDLNGDSTENPGEGPIDAVVASPVPSNFSYASDYMFINVDGTGSFDYAAGDRWIGGIDANHDDRINLGIENVVLLDVSKVAILYDQPNSKVYVRGVNLTQAVSVGDMNGHGTHVASTIAGGQVGMTSYVGVAPGADLIIIKSDLQSADILDGISFAIENNADIINMSFSSYLGFLDGTDLEDLAVTAAFLKHNLITVAAAGNLADKSKHAHFSVGTGGQGSTMLAVSNPPTYSFLSVLWHSSDNDEHVILTPENGAPIDLGAFSEIADTSWAMETDDLSAYVFAEVGIRGINSLVIQISTAEHHWANGVWNVTVTNEMGGTIEVESYAWDGDWGTSHMIFQTAVDSGRTISSPGTADFAVTVAAYSESTSGIMDLSGRGPRVDGAPKPTVAAPGDNIAAARNNVISSLWISKFGTSMASPHVAGVLALIHQASGENSAWLDYSALVNGAGGRTSHYETASTSWGYGLVDALWSVVQVLDSPGIDGTTISDWFGVDELIADGTNSSIYGGQDITSVKSFVDNDTISFAVSMRGAPDFQGPDVLSIKWDTDSNAGTGQNGADIVVNITGGVANVYEWNGSSYDTSLIVSHWWTNSTTVFIRLEGIPLGSRGVISLSTSNSTMVNIDRAGPGTLTDVVLPVMNDFLLESSDGSMLVQMSVGDRDSSPAVRNVAWSIVNGPLAILNSSSRSGESDISITVPESLVGSPYINSLLVNVTSESFTLFLPLVLLSTQIGAKMSFTIAKLDRSVVRVGFLVNDKISGELVLDGFTLASLVYIAFHSEGGTWLNFTLTGNNGVYEFEISPSYFQIGTHEVYAIAKGQTIPGIEVNFATLTVVQDYSVLAIGIVSLIACGAVLVILKRRRSEIA